MSKAGVAARGRIDVWRPAPPPPWRDFVAGGAARTRFLKYWIGDHAKYLADFLALAVLRRLPVEAASAAGGRLARLRGPGHYRIAHARAAYALRRLKPEWSEAEIEAAGLRRWDNIGRLLSEFAVLDRLIPEGRVEIEHREHLEASRGGGRGFVLLGLHLGAWEVSTPVLAHLGSPPTTFYEPPASRSREYISRKVRQKLGARLLPVGMTGLKPALEALAQGEPVALFADETRGGVVQGPFFDRPPHRRGNLALAVRLARQAGVAIQPGYVVRTEGCRFRAVFLPPYRPPPEGRPGERLLEDVLALNALLEPAVRAHLDQWYYLHFPIWPEQLKKTRP